MWKVFDAHGLLNVKRVFPAFRKYDVAFVIYFVCPDVAESISLPFSSAVGQYAFKSVGLV